MLLGAGLLVAVGTGVLALLAGGEVLQTAILERHLPVLGDVKLVTSLFFDIGVYLIVIGLVLDILRCLGAELDRQGEDGPTGSSPRSHDVTVAVVGVLFAAGVYLLLDRSLTRVLIGVLLLANGVNLLLLSGGRYGGAADRRRHTGRAR